MQKNSRQVCVSGRVLLGHARQQLTTATTVFDLALSLLLVTGRRTCEILNGTTRFEAHGLHSVLFIGQAKRTDADAYVIPVLARAADVILAMGRLRDLQTHGTVDNDECSRKYQSGLRRRLLSDKTWAQCGRVHALRGVYVCMSLRLFEWTGVGVVGERPSDAYVAMCILGHRGLMESLVYTPFSVGDDFGDEPTLGQGHLTWRVPTASSAHETPR
jgi:hypothetical protein